MFVLTDVLIDQLTGPDVHWVVGLELEAVPVQDILVLLRAQDLLEVVWLEHLRCVVFPALGGEVDLVEPVLLLPVRGAQLPASLPHHDDPGPYLFFYCK